MTWTFAVQAGLYLTAACAVPVALLLWLDRGFRRRWGDRPGEGRPSRRDGLSEGRVRPDRSEPAE